MVREVEVEGAGGVTRFEIEVEITLAASDVPVREGAVSEDAWLVFRVRGNRGIFPVYLDGMLTESTLPVLLHGSSEQRAEILEGAGVPAIALTAPIFVDFDGAGYRAPFAP